MRVKSITFAGYADVYNMEVEDTHSFAVEGGIIVHNCYDETRYACMSRPLATPKPKEPETVIQRHKRKLMQSRMRRIL